MGFQAFKQEITDLHHIRICGNKQLYCGHPRQGGIFNFANGEIAVIHFHAPCKYEKKKDVKHDFGGYHSRSVALLKRSFDGGETWLNINDVTIFDETTPMKDRRHFLFEQKDRVRKEINMTSKNSIFFFW